MRRVFSVQNAGFIDSVIAEHLIDFRINYTLKPSADGSIFDQPSRVLNLDDAALVRLIESVISVETAYPLQNGQKDQVDGLITVGVRNLQFLEAPVSQDSQGNATLSNPGPTPQIRLCRSFGADLRFSDRLPLSANLLISICHH